MVNPDGVVHGNSRVNLLGVDINRQWLDINKNLSIETFAVTNFLNKLCADYRVEYMFDLHGHSKK
jgi:murein tripeptide amidase MpaA